MASFNEEHKAFADRYNHYVDVVLDGEQFAQALFLEDAQFQIGTFPLSVGHAAIAASANGVYNITRKLKHVTHRILSVNENLFVSEGEVIYTVGDPERVLEPIPISSTFEIVKIDGETKIRAYKAYLDISPLFIAIGMDVTADEEGKPTFVPRRA
jgi:hypothetical protein